MRGQVSWLVDLAVKPGQLDNFRTLTGEMVESTRRESGVLNYERFVSEDGGFVYAYERYADSDAALAHLEAFKQKFSTRFLGMVERRRFMVFGTPAQELKRVLDPLGATYLRPLAD